MPSVAPSKRYAYGTKVDVESSEAEIKRTLKRFGAVDIVIGTYRGRSAVMFEAHERRVRFDLPQPDYAVRYMGGGTEGETKRLWRSLAMCIKAKLEIIESGITTFEQEMLPYTILADGRTFHEAANDPKFTTMLSAATETPMIAIGK